MLEVQIVSYAGRGVNVIATVSYSPDTGVAIETGEEWLRRELMGELAGRREKLYSVHDGEAFVRELPYIYSGSYVRAEIVSDESFQNDTPLSEG